MTVNRLIAKYLSNTLKIMAKVASPANEKKDIKKGKKTEALSTQRYLQFSEVHDDVLVLKNGGLRAVLEVGSINFNLKSEQEQQAIIQGYQRFLNALNFPVQILIRSRKLDIDVDLDDLRLRQKKIPNELLQNQMEGCIEYVQKLVEYSDIMEKKFYVVVPLTPARSDKKGVFSSFFEYISPVDTVLDIMKRKREFKDLKKELDNRINTVKTALENCGLSVSQLSTQEIIEIFYQAYNPDLARSQKYSSLEEMSVEKNPGDNLVADEE